MLDYLQLIILGLVQGLAEFLPISSSGHLVIAEQFLKRVLGGPSLAEGKDVEIMLHIGTLGSIAAVYRRELIKLLRSPRLCAIVVLATIPGALAGVLLEDWFDQVFDQPIVAGFGLLMTAALLTTAHVLERGRFTEETMPWLAAMVVGLFQAIALVPGISRSGSTISAGLLTGMERVAATRFSFLLAVPITGGAIVVTLAKLVKNGGQLSCPIGPLLVGMLVAFVSGSLALHWLVRLVSQRRLLWFAGYCLLMGIATIVWFQSVTAAS